MDELRRQFDDEASLSLSLEDAIQKRFGHERTGDGGTPRRVAEIDSKGLFQISPGASATF